jgi:hypothetical protein
LIDLSRFASTESQGQTWNPIARLLKNRRDRQELLNMRATMMRIHALIFPEDPKTRAIVRMKIGLRLTQQLDNRLGIMGPEFLDPIRIKI